MPLLFNSNSFYGLHTNIRNSLKTIGVKDSLQARALKIFSKFVKTGAQFEVNISSKARSDVLGQVRSGKYDIHMFDKAYNEVSDMIKKDAFRELELQLVHISVSSRFLYLNTTNPSGVMNSSLQKVQRV